MAPPPVPLLPPECPMEKSPACARLWRGGDARTVRCSPLLAAQTHNHSVEAVLRGASGFGMGRDWEGRDGGRVEGTGGRVDS